MPRARATSPSPPPPIAAPASVPVLVAALRAALRAGRCREACALEAALARSHQTWDPAPDTTAERAAAAAQLLAEPRLWHRLDWLSTCSMVNRLLGMVSKEARGALIEGLWAGRAFLPGATDDRWAVFTRSGEPYMRTMAWEYAPMTRAEVRAAWAENDHPQLAFHLLRQPAAPLDVPALVAHLLDTAATPEGRRRLRSVSVSPWPAESAASEAAASEAPRAGRRSGARRPAFPRVADPPARRPGLDVWGPGRPMPWITVAAALLSRPDVPSELLRLLASLSIGTDDLSLRADRRWIVAALADPWLALDATDVRRRIAEGVWPADLTDQVRTALFHGPRTPGDVQLPLAAELLAGPDGAAHAAALRWPLEAMATTWPAPTSPDTRSAWTVLLHRAPRATRLAALARLGAAGASPAQGEPPPDLDARPARHRP